MAALRRTSQPTTEPVTLDAMKNYLRVDIFDDDDLIASLISVARERAEDMTSRCLVSQGWTLALDRFPFHLHNPHGYHFARLRQVVLPRGPVISVDSIQYVDGAGTLQTLTNTAYKTDLLSEPASVLPAYGTDWPAARDEANAVLINFTAGYDKVPQSFLHAIKLMVGAWYENRAEVVQGGGNFNTLPTPMSAKALLSTYEMLPLGYQERV